MQFQKMGCKFSLSKDDAKFTFHFSDEILCFNGLNKERDEIILPLHFLEQHELLA